MTLTARPRLLIRFAVLAALALCGIVLALSSTGTPPVGAQDGSAPAKPTGVVTTATHDSVALAWDDPSDASITHYQIFRRDRDVHDTGEFVTIEENTGSAAESYTDDTVEPEKRYVYRVKAVNQHGASTWSNFVRADTPAAPAPEPDKNSPATGQPIIGGTAEVGETLTADTSGIADADGLGNAVFEYQWLAEDTEVAGATSSTYTPVDADVGKTIKVRVSFADGKNNQEALTSEPTESVAPGSGPLAGFTVVDASDQTVVETLANGGTLALDDPENGSYGIRADVEADTEIGSVRLELTGAKDVDETENLAPYSLYGDGDNGLNGEALPAGQYTLKATAHAERDLNGNVLGTLQVSFTVTGPEDSSGNNPATGAPTITGNAWVSETLTAETSGISDSDGLGSPGYGYQWARHDETTDSDIGGATDSTYTLVDDDKGKTIAVTVSFTDDEGNAEELTSGATGIVVPAPVVIDPALTPSNLTARGSEESVDLSWDSPTQDADTVTGYQILRGKGDGEDGELEVLVADTESGDTSYTDADVPGNLQDYRYQVKALRGEEASRGSNVAEVLVALAAQGNTVGIPVIKGTPRVGDTLRASVSGVTDPDGISRDLSYQWRWILSEDSGPISGALDHYTYTLVDDDLGKNIAVRYSYRDGENNVEEVDSEEVGPVKAALLTALSVDGESVAGFDSGITSYDFGVASTVTRVTVMGVAYHPDATVTYSPADADGGTEGHQVDLVQGRNVVTVTATAEDGVGTRQHTVSVNRGSDAPYGWRADKDFDTLKAAGIRHPTGIWSDGTTMWVADKSSLNLLLGTSSSDDKIYAYALATRARDADKDFDTLEAAGNIDPSAIWSDGTTLWVGDSIDDKLYAYALATRARDADKDFDTLEAAGITIPYGIWSDGTTLWVADALDDKLYAYVLATGARDADKDFDTLEAAGNIYGIWSDGTTLWVMDSIDDKLYAYNMPGTTANNAPAFASNSATRSVAENTAAASDIGAAVTATDADSDTLTYSLEGTDAASFDIDSASGQLQTRAALDHESKSSHAVTVKADDGNGGTDTIAVTVSVSDVAEPPSAPAAPTVTATSGTTDSLDVSWTAPANTGKPDISGYDVQYRAGTSGSWSDWPHTGTAVTATITGITHSTSYQVQVKAKNAEGESGWSASGSGSTGSTGNNAPEFSDGTTTTRSVDENTASGVNIGTAVAATDADSDTLTYSLEGTDAASFSIVGTSGQLRTKAALDFESKSSYSVTASVADGNGGTDTIAVTISVTDVAEPPAAPGAPTVAATSNTTDSLDVSWTAPANTGKPDISGYDVQYRAGTSGSWTDWPHTGTAVTATITGLTHSTSYQVQVKAKNAEGESGWSASGSGSTGTPANNAPAFASNSATRSVAENTAAASDIGTALTATDADSDTLTYSLEGTDAASFDIDSASGQLQTKAALDHEGKSSHAVTVKADDGKGGTDTIAVTISVTDVAEPPAAPGAPTVSATANTTTSLDVSWTAPANTGRPAISGYDVQYRAGTSGSWSDWPHTGTAVTATITGLTHSTSYQVQVKAKNAEGESGWSASGSGSTGTPANNAPEPPSSVTARPDNTELTVTWSQTNDGDSAITKYTVQLKLSSVSGWPSGSVTERTLTGTPPARSHTFTGLTNGTEYTVRVKATNIHGDSDWSDEAGGTPSSKPPPSSVTITTGADQPIDGPFAVTITFNEEVEGFACADEPPDPNEVACDIGAGYVGGALVDVVDLQEVGVNANGEHVFTARVEDILTGTLVVWVHKGKARAVDGGLPNAFGALQVEVKALDQVPQQPVTTVWQASMDVEDVGGYLGYAKAGGLSGGSLTGDTFTWSGQEYTVEALLYNQAIGEVILELSRALPNDGRRMALLIGNYWLDTSNPEPYTHTVAGKDGWGYRWHPVAPYLEAGQANVPVKLVRQAIGASSAQGQAFLSWGDPGDDTITGYRIERRDRDGDEGFTALVDDTGSDDTGYTDRSVEGGGRYAYRVTAMNDAGESEPSGEAHVDVPARPNSPARGAPTISGTAQVGETLTAETRDIEDDDGLSKAVFTYQWLTNSADIAGATSDTYTLVADDVGKAIKVKVSFRDDRNHQESLTSAATAADDSSIWSATLTVGSYEPFLGYYSFTGTGQLDPAEFSLDGNDYTVQTLGDKGSEWFEFGLTKTIQGDFTLQVGGTGFDSADATISDYGVAYIYRWADQTASLSEGDTVEVSLTVSSGD